MSQRTLMGRIKALSLRIADMQGRFYLEKGHPDRWETYGGATSLQRAHLQRDALKRDLDPIRLVATGVSCRDCKHFADVDSPMCWLTGTPIATKQMRGPSPAPCGPNADWFKAHA